MMMFNNIETAQAVYRLLYEIDETSRLSIPKQLIFAIERGFGCRLDELYEITDEARRVAATILYTYLDEETIAKINEAMDVPFPKVDADENLLFMYPALSEEEKAAQKHRLPEWPNQRLYFRAGKGYAKVSPDPTQMDERWFKRSRYLVIPWTRFQLFDHTSDEVVNFGKYLFDEDGEVNGVTCLIVYPIRITSLMRKKKRFYDMTDYDDDGYYTQTYHIYQID